MSAVQIYYKLRRDVTKSSVLMSKRHGLKSYMLVVLRHGDVSQAAGSGESGEELQPSQPIYWEADVARLLKCASII